MYSSIRPLPLTTRHLSSARTATCPSTRTYSREELTRRGLDGVLEHLLLSVRPLPASFDDFRAPVDALCKRLHCVRRSKYLVAMDESDVGLYSEKKVDFPAEVWNNFLEKIPPDGRVYARTSTVLRWFTIRTSRP